MNRALVYLLRAVEHAVHACLRTQQMLSAAIAKLSRLMAMQAQVEAM